MIWWLSQRKLVLLQHKQSTSVHKTTQEVTPMTSQPLPLRRGWSNAGAVHPCTPPPLYKLRPCPSYSRRRDRINLGPNFNLVQNVVLPHKTWVW